AWATRRCSTNLRLNPRLTSSRTPSRHKKRAAPKSRPSAPGEGRGPGSQMDPGFRRDNSTQPLRAARLLELDGAAGVLDLLLDLLGLFLVDAFLDRLGSAFDQRLRLAEAKAGDRADFLDHVDLLAAVAGQDDVELGLLFGRSRSGSAAAGSRARNRDRSRGRDAPLLFER